MIADRLRIGDKGRPNQIEDVAAGRGMSLFGQSAAPGTVEEVVRSTGRPSTITALWFVFLDSAENGWKLSGVAPPSSNDDESVDHVCRHQVSAGLHWGA